MSLQKTVVCHIEDESFANAVFMYGMTVAKTLELPILLLNTITHKHLPVKTDLSGNIGLRSCDDLLDELATSEQKMSKASIKKGRELLEKLKLLAKESNFSDVTSVQKHGDLYENIKDYEESVRLLIVGCGSNDDISQQTKEIVRHLKIPTLLVKNEFLEPKKVMIAYDGSESAAKALEMVAKTPLFRNIKRYIVTVGDDEGNANMILEGASLLLKANGIDAESIFLEGERGAKLLEFAEKEDIDIIAMGAFSHNRLREIFLGSLTSKMIEQSKVPVLLLR